MATLPDIDSREKLEAWLKDKPREWAPVIASRAALRVLPTITRIFDVSNDRIIIEQKRKLNLNVFRANLVSTVVTLATIRPLFLAAKAVGEIFDFSYARYIGGDRGSGVAAAVGEASVSAAEASVTLNVNFALYSIETASSEFSGDKFWPEVKADALWLLNRLEQLTGEQFDPETAKMFANLVVADLAGTKLWTKTQPAWMKAELTSLAHHINESGDWSHWIDWYQARLHGRPYGLHPQLAGKLRDDFDYRVATQPDEWWARGPEAVNADIARWIAEATAELAARNDGDNPDADDLNDVDDADDPDDLTRIYELGPEVDSDWDPYEPQDDGEDAFAFERAAAHIGALEQSRAGLPIEVEGDELRIGATGAECDLEAAANRLTRQLHGEVIPLARDFAELAMRLDNRHGWTGIGRAASRLADFLAQGPEAVADNIGLVWVDSVRLGSFLEQDTAILAGQSEIADPLVAEDRRKLSDLVTVAAPYIRRYPSARELDVESRAFKASDTLIAEGRAVIAAAQQTGLLNRQDGKTIEAIFDTAGHGGVQGHKAGSVAVETARNVIIKAGAVVTTLYVGAVLGAAAPHSVLVSRGVETFLTSEKAIIELVKDMPDDIGIAYRILIEGMKDPAILPSRPRLARRREDEAKPQDK